MVIIVGCKAREGDNRSQVVDDIVLTDSITNEEMQTQEGLTLVELKDLLETSNSIEVKNTDNQVIGKINTGEKINKVVDDIFKHTAVDDYEYSSGEDVVAIINFYPSGNEPIYGLIKEKFLYIEGYYFTSRNNSISKIIDYFRLNTEEEPIVGD